MASKNGSSSQNTSILDAVSSTPSAQASVLAGLLNVDSLEAAYNAPRTQTTAVSRATRDERWEEAMQRGLDAVNDALPGERAPLPDWMKDPTAMTSGALSKEQIRDVNSIGGQNLREAASRATVAWIGPEHKLNLGDKQFRLAIYHSDEESQPCTDPEVLVLDPDAFARMLSATLDGATWIQTHKPQFAAFRYKDLRDDLVTGRGNTLLAHVHGVDARGNAFNLGVKRFFMPEIVFTGLCEPFQEGSNARFYLRTRLGGKFPQTHDEMLYLAAITIVSRVNKSDQKKLENIHRYVVRSVLNVTGALPLEWVVEHVLYGTDGLAQLRDIRVRMAEVRAQAEKEGRSFAGQNQLPVAKIPDQFDLPF